MCELMGSTAIVAVAMLRERAASSLLCPYCSSLFTRRPSVVKGAVFGVLRVSLPKTRHLRIETEFPKGTYGNRCAMRRYFSGIFREGGAIDFLSFGFLVKIPFSSFFFPFPAFFSQKRLLLFCGRILGP